MNMWKRFAPRLILLGIICLIAAFGYVKTEIIGVNTTATAPKTIILDAGHGGLTNTIKV